jgi:hypothetical protein
MFVFREFTKMVCPYFHQLILKSNMYILHIAFLFGDISI